MGSRTRNWLECAAEAWRGMRRHPVRSLLAALASASAVAVTANVISLARGFDRDVREDVSQFGRRTVDVVPALTLVPGLAASGLDERVWQELAAVVEPFGATLVPRRHLARRVGLPLGAGKWAVARSATVVAAPHDIASSTDVPLLAGRWWKEDDDLSPREPGVAVLDAALARVLLAQPGERVARPGTDVRSLVGSTIALGRPTADPAVGAEDAPSAFEPGSRFEVIGVLDDPMRYRALFEELDVGQDTRMLGSSILSFRNLYIPFASPEARDATRGLTGVTVVARSEDEVEGLANRLDKWLAARSTPTTPVLAVVVRKRWMDQMGGTTQHGAVVGNILWMLVCLVASVLVATINLSTVRERYDELAIRRIEGARRRDVAALVALESMFSAGIGGCLGLPLGLVGAHVLSAIVEFPFRLDLGWAAAAACVGVAIGALAALLPAWRAARLEPALVLARRPT